MLTPKENIHARLGLAWAASGQDFKKYALDIPKVVAAIQADAYEDAAEIAELGPTGLAIAKAIRARAAESRMLADQLKSK